MGKIIGSLVISYFIIGSVIFGSQLALSTFLDPVCIGAEQHRLLDRYFPTRNQIHELEKNPHRQARYWRCALDSQIGLARSAVVTGPIPRGRGPAPQPRGGRGRSPG
jgi:hypothetical protein